MVVGIITARMEHAGAYVQRTALLHESKVVTVRRPHSARGTVQLIPTFLGRGRAGCCQLGTAATAREPRTRVWPTRPHNDHTHACLWALMASGPLSPTERCAPRRLAWGGKDTFTVSLSAGAPGNRWNNPSQVAPLARRTRHGGAAPASTCPIPASTARHLPSLFSLSLTPALFVMLGGTPCHMYPTEPPFPLSAFWRLCGPSYTTVIWSQFPNRPPGGYAAPGALSLHLRFRL